MGDTWGVQLMRGTNWEPGTGNWELGTADWSLGGSAGRWGEELAARCGWWQQRAARSTSKQPSAYCNKRSSQPCSQFPVPSSQFPVPSSRFPVRSPPVPDSRFPIPDSRSGCGTLQRPMHGRRQRFRRVRLDEQLPNVQRLRRVGVEAIEVARRQDHRKVLAHATKLDGELRSR